jgi:hypothetical protein
MENILMKTYVWLLLGKINLMILIIFVWEMLEEENLKKKKI